MSGYSSVAAAAHGTATLAARAADGGVTTGAGPVVGEGTGRQFVIITGPGSVELGSGLVVSDSDGVEDTGPRAFLSDGAWAGRPVRYLLSSAAKRSTGSLSLDGKSEQSGSEYLK